MSAGNLTVKVSGVRNDKGLLSAALYDSESSFMNVPSALLTPKVHAAHGDTLIVFHDLPAGKYAMSVFHDENANGKFDKNFLGIPVEEYGFSNTNDDSGVPSFSKAAFDYDGTNRTIVIGLHY